MPAIVDKASVIRVCVDDFAFRKRYNYGMVMVDLDSHRIIDIIDSRETKRVEEWLKSYPCLEIISRDRAQPYSSAAQKSHPDAVQISDRFHLLKNLSDAVERYMYRLFPSRLVIPASVSNPEMQALYDTRNRRERILFAQKKRAEGYSINYISLLLHSAAMTVQKYLSLSEDDLPVQKENVRERQHIQAIANKQMAINEVKRLYCEGHAIDEIPRLTGHTYQTVKKYLKEDGSSDNGHYDCRRPGRLAPYEQEVIEMRSQGLTYKKIHNCARGYTGTEASLRVFMQKERTHQKSISSANQTESVEYIPRKCLCQLIYRVLEKVKGMTGEQYDAAIKKYPVIGQLYSLLREFHHILFSQKENELDSWMSTASALQIEELDTYINGLKANIAAVKNGIHYKYNNGLAEGSVNKIKLTKRIMYGWNSFELFKAKLLLNEIYYQIN